MPAQVARFAIRLAVGQDGRVENDEAGGAEVVREPLGRNDRGFYEGAGNGHCVTLSSQFGQQKLHGHAAS
jgi:hypothetical protein